MTAGARAYPWTTLERVSAADVLASRAVSAWAGGGARRRDASLATALGDAVRARVEIRVNHVRAATRGKRSDTDVGVILGSHRVQLDRAVLVEAEAALAMTLVARALRREVPAMVAPNATVAGQVAGAFAGVVLAATRRASTGDVPRVLSAGPAKALAQDLAASAGELYEVRLTVLVEDDAYLARVLVPRAVARGAAPPTWSTSALMDLGETPLALSIVAGGAMSTALEVGTLRRGDAWLPGGLRIRRGPGGGLVGQVLLAAPSHDVGLVADLGEDGGLVLRAGVEELSWTGASAEEERPMGESEKDTLVEAVGEVPVAVRVEIGVVEMRAREWASLGVGDVVGLGKKIGETVTLRVGGVTVARGELVDLDGEVGVRILGRLEGR